MNHSPIQKTVAPIHDETKTPIRNTKANDVIKPSPAPKTKSLLILYITFKRKSKVKYQDPDHPLERLKYKRRKEYRRGLAPPILFVCVDREKKQRKQRSTRMRAIRYLLNHLEHN